MTRNPDGTWQWRCGIDRAENRRAAVKGLCSVAGVIAFTVVLGALIGDLRVALIPAGVIMAVALPLLILQHSASDPHEQYVMGKESIRCGYGKAAVRIEYGKVRRTVLGEKCLELETERKSMKIFCDPEYMEFVTGYIMTRLPDNAGILDRRGYE